MITLEKYPMCKSIFKVLRNGIFFGWVRKWPGKAAGKWDWWYQPENANRVGPFKSKDEVLNWLQLQ